MCISRKNRIHQWIKDNGRLRQGNRRLLRSILQQLQFFILLIMVVYVVALADIHLTQILVFLFNIAVRYEADNWNKLKNVCSKTIGEKKKVSRPCLVTLIDSSIGLIKVEIIEFCFFLKFFFGILE